MKIIMRLIKIFAFSGVIAFNATLSYSQEQTTVTNDTALGFTVSGQVALNSFMSISDAHLQKMSHVLTILSTSDDLLSRDWRRISARLEEVSHIYGHASYFYGLPDGTYRTVAHGLSKAKLSDRPFFSRLCSGHKVIGDLIIGRSTGRSSVVVAVPVHDHNNSFVGALGCSSFLNNLSEKVLQEMGGLEEGLFFFSVNAEPRGALHSDTSLIFANPMKLGDEGMRQAFKKMLASKDGVINYTFRGRQRIVLYRKSPVTGWWYALGKMRQ